MKNKPFDTELEELKDNKLRTSIQQSEMDEYRQISIPAILKKRRKKKNR